MVLKSQIKKDHKKNSLIKLLDSISIRTNKAENTHMWFNTILREANLLSFAQSVKISQIPLPLNPGGWLNIVCSV